MDHKININNFEIALLLKYTTRYDITKRKENKSRQSLISSRSEM